MPAPIKLNAGDTFGRLTVVGISQEKVYGSRAWECTCTCGKPKVARASDLLRGLVASCGCLAADTQRYVEPVPEGTRYGNWTVISELDNPGSNHRMFNVVCICGNQGKVTLNALSTGHSKSCGCLMRQQVSERFTTHGMTNTKTYAAWHSMLSRVSENSVGREHYYDRGIVVDPEWLVFENFYRDMGEAPEGLTLDRRDNDGNYCKDNCRWATSSEQNRNKQRKGSPKLGVKLAVSGKYYAKIRDIDGKGVHLGTSDTYEGAVALREAAELKVSKGESVCKS